MIWLLPHPLPVFLRVAGQAYYPRKGEGDGRGADSYDREKA